MKRIPAFWRTPVGEEVDAELESHLRHLVDELVTEQGMTPEDARREALRRFGDLGHLRSSMREEGTLRERARDRSEYFAGLRQDLRLSLRHLRRTPGFALMAILTLALGIGASTAIFSVVQSVVLRPFPWREPERVVLVSEWWQGQRGSVSPGNFAEWRRDNRAFASMAAIQFGSFNLTDEEGNDRVLGSVVSPAYFDVFGVTPILGRVFLPAEEVPGAGMVVILSERLWRDRFNADSTILGRTIRLSGYSFTVVGVMPASFDPMLNHGLLWMAADYTPEQLAVFDSHTLTVVARLRDGVTLAAAQDEMNALMRGSIERHPRENGSRAATALRLDQILIGDQGDQVVLLLGAVLLVLLIGCANVTNLLLARGAARAREFSIRGALGAGRGRIVRQILVETAVIAGISLVLALVVARIGLHLLIVSAPEDSIPRLDQATLDLRVLGFAALLGVTCAILAGLAPAIGAGRTALQAGLKEGGRDGGAVRRGMRTGLIVSEVALALTLLTGAGLLIRSAWYLQRIDVGFDPTGVITGRVTLPSQRYPQPERIVQAYEDMVEKLRHTPGVTHAAAVSRAPFGGGGNNNGLTIEGQPRDAASAIDAGLRMVTPGYREAMGIRLIAGRFIEDTDVAGGERVMVVSQALANRAWPGQNPIGKRMMCCEGDDTDPRMKTVVGVVGDVRGQGPTIDVRPEFYLPIRQVPPEAWGWTGRTLTLVARGTGPATALAAPMRSVVREVDPALTLFSVGTLEDGARESVAQVRFYMLLLMLLSGLGLLLAVIGIYSVVAYFTQTRTREIGLRVALGASSGEVVRMMTRHGMRSVLIGLAIGTLLSAYASRFLESTIFGIEPGDPLTLAATALLLAVVALVATALPARRAATVDPVQALRN